MQVSYIKPYHKQNIPNVLIYNRPRTDVYMMATTNSPSKVVGRMDGAMSYFKGKKAFEVYGLLIFDRRRGYGKKFVEFAKNLSKKNGGDGRVFLDAAVTPYDPFNPPHVFYRKQGFVTDNKKMLKRIDESIKKDKALKTGYLATLMYYPPEPEVKKETLLQKIFNKIVKR